MLPFLDQRELECSGFRLKATKAAMLPTRMTKPGVREAVFASYPADESLSDREEVMLMAGSMKADMMLAA